MQSPSGYSTHGMVSWEVCSGSIWFPSRACLVCLWNYNTIAEAPVLVPGCRDSWPKGSCWNVLIQLFFSGHIFWNILQIFFKYHVCIYLVLLEMVHSRHFNHSGTSFLKMDVRSGVHSAFAKKSCPVKGASSPLCVQECIHATEVDLAMCATRVSPYRAHQQSQFVGQ